MRKIALIEDILKMRMSDICEKFNKKELTTEDAADILEISVRTFLRMRIPINSRTKFPIFSDPKV